MQNYTNTQYSIAVGLLLNVYRLWYSHICAEKGR